MLRSMVAGLIAAGTFAPVAAETVKTVITAAEASSNTTASVEISFLNEGAPIAFEPPATLAADIAVAGSHRTIALTRNGRGERIMLAAGGFVSRSYTVSLAEQATAATLTLAGGSAFTIAAAPRMATATLPPERAANTVGVSFAGKPVAFANNDRGNAFLGNLSGYAPIYAVYGPNTNTAALLQISFKYQLFGTRGHHSTWLEGFDFAYTQRLFWDLGAKSSPFRNIDYNPELIYLPPAIVTRGGTSFAGQAGIAHLSNGRDGTDSRSLNYVYLQPTATLPIGDWRLTLGPRVTAYVGDLSDNPDIARYRGNTGLFAQIGTDDGWRLSTTSRINFDTGKGAVDAELTYPLNRLIPGLNLYAFGQGFTGYGENLLDYNRRQTRVRVGFGIVR